MDEIAIARDNAVKATFLDEISVPIYRRSRAALVMVLLSFFAVPSVSAEASAEIPILIANQTGADGKPLPAAPTITGIVELLAKESGLNLVVRPYPWRRAQLLAEKGEGLLYGAAATPERLLVFNFTKPLYSVHQWLVASAQRPFDFQNWEDLRGRVISIQSGARFVGEFEARRDKLFTVQENSETFSSRLKMLALGRVDAVLIDSYRNARQFEARLNCVYSDVGKWIVLEKPVGTEPVLIAISQSSPLNHILPALNDAIDRLSKSQGIHKILQKQSTSTAC